MDLFLEDQPHSPEPKSCALCGKSLKYPVGIFPSEDLPDIVEEACSDCNALFCHECSLTYPRHHCPICGAGALVTVHDEDEKDMARTLLSVDPTGDPTPSTISPTLLSSRAER